MKRLLLVAVGSLLASIGCGSGGFAAAIDGGPTIAIVSPVDGTGLLIATSTEEPVTFTVAGFGLRAPGLCGAVNDVCGHVHVLVDDAACNAPGQNFNNAFPTAGLAPSTATAIALLSNCASPAGTHAIRLELHRDDHSPVTNGASATVTIAAGATGGGLADAGGDGVPADASGASDGLASDGGASDAPADAGGG